MRRTQFLYVNIKYKVRCCTVVLKKNNNNKIIITKKFNTKGTYSLHTLKHGIDIRQHKLDLNLSTDVLLASANNNKTLTWTSDILCGFRQLVNTELENRPSSHLLNTALQLVRKNLVRQKNSLGTCIPFGIRF